MVADDVLVVDMDGNIVEGTRKASVDTQALLYILKNMPKVNAVIHTHQPYATGPRPRDGRDPLATSRRWPNAVEGPATLPPYGETPAPFPLAGACRRVHRRPALAVRPQSIMAVIAVGRNPASGASSRACTSKRPAKTVSVALSTGLPMAEMTDCSG